MLQAVGDDQARQPGGRLFATARTPLLRATHEDRAQPDPRGCEQVAAVSSHHGGLSRLAPEQFRAAQVGPRVGLVAVGELRSEDRVDSQVGEAEQVDQQRHMPVGQGRGAESGAQPLQPRAGVRPGPQPPPGHHERLPLLGWQRDAVATNFSKVITSSLLTKATSGSQDRITVVISIDRCELFNVITINLK